MKMTDLSEDLPGFLSQAEHLGNLTSLQLIIFNILDHDEASVIRCFKAIALKMTSVRTFELDFQSKCPSPKEESL